MLSNFKNKINLLLSKVISKKQASEENKIIETPSEDIPTADENKAAIIFYVKKTSPEVYEVSLKNFLGIKGRGTNPEQALNDLIANINSSIDDMVKSILLTSVHKEEIASKYSILVSDFYEKKENTNLFKKIINKLKNNHNKVLEDRKSTRLNSSH